MTIFNEKWVKPSMLDIRYATQRIRIYLFYSTVCYVSWRISIIDNLLLFQANSRQLIKQADIIKEQKKFEDNLQNKSNEKSLTIAEIKSKFEEEIDNQQKHYERTIEKYKEEINSLRGELQA